MANDQYVHGTYNVICDRCGFKFKATQCRKEWTGLFVCSKCWEARHPQDFVRAKRDEQKVPIARPEGTDVFIDSTDVSADDL